MNILNNDDINDELIDYLRDFMRLIYKQLETDYEFRMSDEYIDDMIINNEYEFLDNGSMYY